MGFCMRERESFIKYYYCGCCDDYNDNCSGDWGGGDGIYGFFFGFVGYEWSW